jgi:alkanesulfonate monooxygenase SsuD/methylene tetrahydromethanopterin reductase-like flavin-dependent oxidoreductase (luciferase family)
MFEEVVMNLIEENAMQYGLYLPNYGVFGDVRLLADLAREAEAVGWDGFFLWDHIAEQYEDTTTMLPMIDPWVALAAIAMQTEKLRIGTTVTPLPRRRPWKLARETVSIDRLSNGRLILGVGIGAGELEWDHLGEETDLRSRGQMLDEGLDILTGLWSGEPFSYSGKHYQIEHAQFLPTPVQQPRIPIWVGGLWGNKAPFRRMARWDGMFPLFDVFGPEQHAPFKESVQYVQSLRSDPTNPFDIIKMGVTPGDNSDESRGRIQPAIDAGATWWLELMMPEVYELGHGPEAFDLLRKRVMQGPPRV